MPAATASPLATRQTITHADWLEQGTTLFGPDQMDWRFVCPVCKHVASVRDYFNAKAPEGAVGYSCIGRYLPEARKAFEGAGPGPCNYAGGGLFRLNPITVTDCPEGRPDGNVFAFDTPPTT